MGGGPSISRCAATGRRSASRRCACRRSGCASARSGARRRPPRRCSAASRPSGWARMACEQPLRRARARTIATSLPSLATYSGSRPRNSQAASTCALHRHGGLVDAACPRRTARRSRSASSPARRASGRAARACSGTASTIAATRPCSAAVSDSRSVSKASDSRCDITATPWSPIVPETRMRSPGRARSPEMCDARRHHADAGGGDEDAVALALLDHLGVAGDHRHAGLARGGGHRLDDALQVGQREAFLEDEARRQVQRPCARHGHVVDGAVHRQAADVAAGKEQRRDDVAVGGITRRPLGLRQQRLVVALAQPLVVEGARRTVARPAAPSRGRRRRATCRRGRA